MRMRRYFLLKRENQIANWIYRNIHAPRIYTVLSVFVGLWWDCVFSNGGSGQIKKVKWLVIPSFHPSEYVPLDCVLDYILRN